MAPSRFATLATSDLAAHLPAIRRPAERRRRAPPSIAWSSTTTSSTQRQGRFGSAGVAIYFPESKRAYDNDPDGDGYALGNTHYPWSSSIASAGPGSSTPISTR
jgi:hypothetical protein